MKTTVPGNLETLTFVQLTELERKVADAKTRKYDQACVSAEVQLRSKLDSIVKQLGIRADDAPVVEAPTKAAKRRGKIAVKFRNPEKPDETWTGRGRAPRWLTSIEKVGGNRETFRVSA